MLSNNKGNVPVNYEICKWILFVPLPKEDGDGGDCKTVILFTKPHRM